MSDQSRRKLLKSIAVGSGAIVAGKSLPETWSHPVVDSVLLPAHAQTSGITLTSTGVIAGLDMTTDSNTMMGSQDGLLDSLIPSAHAASCSAEGRCASANINGNSGTLTVNGVGSSPFTLDGTNTATGTVGGIPFILTTNVDKTTGTLSFQGDCDGYGVLLNINASCSEVVAQTTAFAGTYEGYFNRNSPTAYNGACGTAGISTHELSSDPITMIIGQFGDITLIFNPPSGNQYTAGTGQLNGSTFNFTVGGTYTETATRVAGTPIVNCTWAGIASGSISGTVINISHTIGGNCGAPVDCSFGTQNLANPIGIGVAVLNLV